MKPESSVIFLPVRDIEKTVEFYRDALKLPVHQKQSDKLYIFDTGYGYRGFCEYGDDRKPLSGPQGVCLSLNLPDNEAVLERFEEFKNVCRVYRQPARHPVFPVYSFFLLDPDDYLVEFQKVAEL